MAPRFAGEQGFKALDLEEPGLGNAVDQLPIADEANAFRGLFQKFLIETHGDILPEGVLGGCESGASRGMLGGDHPLWGTVILSCLNPLLEPPLAQRILVIRLGAVGDVVRTLPAVSALRAGYPQAKISWLVEKASSNLLYGQPWIDEVIVFPRENLSAALRGLRLPEAKRVSSGIVRELRERNFDLVVDFHGILKTGVLGKLSGAARRVGYARPFGREASYLFATDLAELAPEKGSRFDRNISLVRFLGLRTVPDAKPLRYGADVEQRVREQLADGSNPIVIHPGTSAHTAHKRYTAEGYAVVVRALAEHGSILVTHGPAAEERRFAEKIVFDSYGRAELAPETPSLMDLAALFSLARLYIGSDTGPLHVASLVGTPVVQLIGPTNIVENEPWRETPFQRVQAPLQGRPSGGRQEPGRRMAGIEPAWVIAAAKELLKKSPLAEKDAG